MEWKFSLIKKGISSFTIFIYRFFERANITSVAEERNIPIDWILEAGCHDGTDTILLHNYFIPEKYLAFEPDLVAFSRAIEKVKEQKITTIQIFNYGLSDTNTSVFLRYEAEGKGSGSTHFGDTGEDSIQIFRFDDCHVIEQINGLLWLDVEGHARQVLSGMHNSLFQIAIAKIEVQLHTRNVDFVQDFRDVIKIMKEASLLPLYGPIHPAFFGDIIFVRKEYMSMLDFFRSKILLIQMNLLHLFIYPKLNKPT